MKIIAKNTGISFKANPNSSKLKFVAKDFYINIKGYGKNSDWAQAIIKTADEAAESIKKGSKPENILRNITNGVRDANKWEPSVNKFLNTGILRTCREMWDCEITDLYTYFATQRYSGYADRLISLRQNPLKSPKQKIAMTRPLLDEPSVKHGESKYLNKSLNFIFKKCQELFSKYVGKNIEDKDLRHINSRIAEIRWVIAHATPWKRGSDAIGNVFMRAIYKSMGIKTYPIKKGISLDLQAFCTNLNQYKKDFPKYFEKNPTIIKK